jgi:hypothetical protein
MANFFKGDRVKLRSGRIGTILDVITDHPMAMHCCYMVSMEPGHTKIRVNGLDILSRVTPLGNLPTNVQNASRGLVAFASWPNMFRALQDVDEALVLAHVNYVLQGSAAAILHGASVSVAPGDLDVCVGNLMAAREALAAKGFQPQPNSSHAVAKFRHPNGTDIDIVMAAEFGVNITRRTLIQGAWVLTLVETITSILLRPEIRQKEVEAFNSLLLLRGNELSPEDRVQVVNRAKAFTGGRVKTWDEAVNLAQEANKHFKMGI